MGFKAKKSLVCTLFFTGLFFALIYLVKNVDVAPVGFYGRIVGLSFINEYFHNLFGLNMMWYNITNYPGMVIDLLVVFVFAIIGLKQWIKRKSIFKVDKNLFVLGSIYLISFFIYILFEKLAINYRPVAIPGKKILEPSFPSSHTMWVIVVMGAAIAECSRLMKNIKIKKIINYFLYAVILITIVGRIISGVHWFTDILGGIFVGLALLSLYYFLVNIIGTKRNKSGYNDIL